MSWIQEYGYSDCVLCDIVDHQPWEPATFVYEDDEVSVFHNILNWIPVMLLAVPKQRLAFAPGARARHFEQRDLWRQMGRLGAVAIEMGRRRCIFDGAARFRLVCNFGSLALQTQSHAHMHVLGSPFAPSYPDLRRSGSRIFRDNRLSIYRGSLDSDRARPGISALMVVPEGHLQQDEFFAGMNAFGNTILEQADREMGTSYRLLAEVGPHAPIENNGAHLFILGGSWLGHYV